ncbi:hypothetical protein P691DRAFT_424873 [Macrolepiota fuliginosa MF-IS2]|uniref:Serine-threonine/tyrosine-protein kinase catalytic domain-containing protein n=1 Tax=Macrolepiota fuliginosa MF-IS2 TaxID=1400762 RepID=A0A9P6C3N9_9AGAR|nr:hypothetical protein P691DRAFT_424873 [Macrolepiota fuliginosa MF-IS2]
MLLQVLSRKVPFYQLDNDPQVKEAVLRGEHPLRPDPKNVDCDAIDKPMWDLLEGCWEMKPESRPNCETIREVLAANMKTQDARPPAAVGAVRKVATNTKIDYHRVKKILHRIKDTSISAGE